MCNTNTTELTRDWHYKLLPVKSYYYIKNEKVLGDNVKPVFLNEKSEFETTNGVIVADNDVETRVLAPVSYHELKSLEEELHRKEELIERLKKAIYEHNVAV